jgi:hypothetical protein
MAPAAGGTANAHHRSKAKRVSFDRKISRAGNNLKLTPLAVRLPDSRFRVTPGNGHAPGLVRERCAGTLKPITPKESPKLTP